MTRWCPADGCRARITPRRLLCERHWKRVPRELVANLYEELRRHGARSREYLAAARAAIDEATRRERAESEEARA